MTSLVILLLAIGALKLSLVALKKAQAMEDERRFREWLNRERNVWQKKPVDKPDRMA
jgi:hypothetical protein